MKRFLLIIAILGAILSYGKAQDGYKIEVTIKNTKDTAAYLIHYYGNGNRMADTAYIDNKGRFIFSGVNKLPGGMFILADQSRKKKYMEFIVDQDQHFKIQTDTAHFFNNLEFKGCEQNSEFMRYSRFIGKNQETMQKLNMDLQNFNNIPPSPDVDSEKIKKDLTDQIDSLNKLVKAEQLKIIDTHPDWVLSQLIKLQWEPEIPFDYSEEDSESMKKAYRYYVNHYWDDINLKDPRIVNMPGFHKKIDNYMKNYLFKDPDSLIYFSEWLIAHGDGHPDLFQYYVWMCFNSAARSKVMTMDKAYVYLAEQYYLSGKAFWVPQKMIDNIRDIVKMTKPNIIGNVAPELQMLDTNDVLTSLHAQKAEWLIVVFWDYDCGHCKQALPKVQMVHEKYKQYGVEVFSICTKSNKKKWKKYIVDKNHQWINVNGAYGINYYDTLYNIRSTPVIYLLDKDKIIRYKKLSPEQLDELLAQELADKIKEAALREEEEDLEK